MQKITTVSELRMEIERMEDLRDADLILLKEQFKITQDSLTPSNIIKKTFNNIFSSPDVRTSLINATLGITSGIVAEKILVGNSHNPIKKIMGATIKFLVTNKVVKNADEIKIIGGMILNKISKKSTENKRIIMVEVNTKTSSLIKFTLVLFSLSLIITILYIGQSIFIPLVLALLFAIILTPFASFLNLKLRFPKSLAAIVSVVLFFAVIAVVIVLISLQISDMTNDWIQIKKNLLVHYEHAQHWVKSKYHLSYNKQDDYMQKAAQTSMNGDSQFIGNTLSSFTDMALNIILIPIYSFLILLYRNLFISFLYQMVRYKNEEILVEVLSKIKSVIKRYIVGIFIEMGIVGTLTTTGFLILGIHYAVLLGAITALLNLIPYIGILVAGTIAIFATLGNSTDVYLIVGIITVNIVVQFIDNNIIVPKIVGNKVSINSLVTMIGVIIGGSLWGIPGMVLSIPIIAIIKIIFDNIDSLKPWGALLGNIIPANSRKSILNKLKIIKS